MNIPKLFFLVFLTLVGFIFIGVLFKKPKEATKEVPIEAVFQESLADSLPPIEIDLQSDSAAEVGDLKEEVLLQKSLVGLPEADLVEYFFNKTEPKFPIVDTIVYKSRVPWLKGRPAWLSDYASYFSTSRHFIARSLNGKVDYFKQNVSEGDRFNVFRKDKDVKFYLIVDLSRCRMWFYYHDLSEPLATLVKTYSVGLGRVDPKKTSGFLTPLGKYSIGQKVAIYKPGTKGFYNNEQKEMMTVFGTRWLPFEEELGGNTAPAKGLGIHGLPWGEKGGKERIESLGTYDSDGCVRLKTEDVEELFSIIITKPTIIELVKDFHSATLPINK